MNPSVLKVGKCHRVWSTVRNNVHDSKRAQLKCCLLDYIYSRQIGLPSISTLNPTCKLCLSAPETRQHFIAECVFFDSGQGVILYIRKLLTNQILPEVQIRQLWDPEFLTQLTLDASALINIRDINLAQLGVAGTLY